MKKILLIGDSIRLGYDKYIKMAFEDVAEVYYPAENSRFVMYVYRRLHEWKNELQCGQVIKCLEESLGIKGQALDYDSLFAETKDILGV